MNLGVIIYVLNNHVQYLDHYLNEEKCRWEQVPELFIAGKANAFPS